MEPVRATNILAEHLAAQEVPTECVASVATGRAREGQPNTAEKKVTLVALES